MAAKKKAAKAQRAAVRARYNPYVQRVVDDEDLRQNIVQAYESSRDAFDAPEQRQVALEADLRRQEAAEGPQGGGGVVPRRQRRAPRGPEEAAQRRLRPAPAARPRRRRRRARPLRGPAQEGAGRAVRRRGGVRVHLDDDLHAFAAADRRQHDLARLGDNRSSAKGAHRAPFSFPRAYAPNTPRARHSALGEPFRRSRRVATAFFGSSRPAITSTQSSKPTLQLHVGVGRAAGGGRGRAVVEAQVPRLGVRELPLQRHRHLGRGARVDRAAHGVEQQRHRLGVARGTAVLLTEVAARAASRARAWRAPRPAGRTGRPAGRAATRAGGRPSAAWTRTSARPPCRSPRA